jgi:methionyl-tRNA formyltransferase
MVVDRMGSPFRTIVLSCGDLGVQVANALIADGASDSVTLIHSPYVRRRRSLLEKIRHVVRRQGAFGLFSVLGAKLRLFARSRAADTASMPLILAPEIERIQVSDFHSEECLSAIRALRPDLAVVAGTYILKPAVFSLPRLGSINLHSGKVPEYRGSAPAFWELYNGETAVGITIHRVVDSVDAGSVFAQELYPFDPAPEGDPLVYIERFRREVLAPNGVRLLVNTVRALAERRATEIPQNPMAGKTYPTPRYGHVRELRRRVRERRTHGR